jgi:hypothetical protein
VDVSGTELLYVLAALLGGGGGIAGGVALRRRRLAPDDAEQSMHSSRELDRREAQVRREVQLETAVANLDKSCAVLVRTTEMHAKQAQDIERSIMDHEARIAALERVPTGPYSVIG